MIVEPRLQKQVDQHPYPLVFATISGAHLYGFPSADSDYDLRGVHLLPLAEVVGLQVGHETVEKSGVYDGLEVDLVTHDARKFFALLLRKNGYVLEQLLSPLVVHSTPEHEELKALSQGCITRHHAHHYLGFAATQWKLFEKDHPPKVKPLLYVYRVLLTGIHLMHRPGRGQPPAAQRAGQAAVHRRVGRRSWQAVNVPGWRMLTWPSSAGIRTSACGPRTGVPAEPFAGGAICPGSTERPAGTTAAGGR